MAKTAPAASKTARRRPYEYDHEYGLGGTKKAAPVRAPRGTAKAAASRKKTRSA